MNKGKPMLHSSKKPIQIVIKRLRSISAGVCFWSGFFAYLTFCGIVCYNLYKKIVRKAFAMRLDKFVSSQRNDISRSMVRELCRKGQVTVNGKVAKAADAKVSENDIVAVKGVEICYKKFVYIMMNKPQGVVCSTRSGRDFSLRAGSIRILRALCFSLMTELSPTECCPLRPMFRKPISSDFVTLGRKIMLRHSLRA